MEEQINENYDELNNVIDEVNEDFQDENNEENDIKENDINDNVNTKGPIDG